jgi:nucleoside-diphosphate-sugar epimerase
LSASDGREVAFRDRRVLVTGGTGFLGSHLVRRLVVLGARVHVFARARSPLHRIADVTGSVKLLTGDMRRRKDVDAAVATAQPEIVFHLAAWGVDPRRRDAATILQTNVLGLVHLLEATAPLPYRRFVNTGTCFEYGNRRDPITEASPVEPLNVYAASKLAALELCAVHARERGKPIVTLRPFTFYGPGERADRLVPSVILDVLAQRPIRITAGTQTRDYTWVGDMAEAFVLAAVTDAAVGEVINIGTGHDRPVREIAEDIRRILGGTGPIETGAVPSRTDDAWRLCADPAKAAAVLGWRPRVSFEDGVRATAEWLRRPRGPRRA